MPERGATPQVSKVQRRVLDALSAFSSPLLVDDYLEMVNPLWSTRELRGKIERIDDETPDAATVLIRPGYRWSGHQPGQYLRIGIDIDGVRHWRAYSLTSDPERPDGCISITVKNVDEGQVSPRLVRKGHPGTIVSLGGVEGEFVLPDELPRPPLFISAGSGITPIMSMIRSLAHHDELGDVVLIHSAREPEDVIFGQELRELAEAHEGGEITFVMNREETETSADGTTPILEAGEEAGLVMPYGCREGICHTCACTLLEGRVRDLRSGKVYGQEGETVRVCISAPEGAVTIKV